MSRGRRWLLAGGVLLLAAAGALSQESTTVPPDAAPPPGADPHESDNPDARPDADQAGFVEITPGVEAALNAGTRFLVSRQLSDGAFSTIGVNSDGAFGEREEYCIAVTALSGLALMAQGSTMSSGPHASQVRRAVDFFLRLYPGGDHWYISLAGEGSRMHGHGFATLFLAEALGTDPGNQRLSSALHAAVNVIVAAQEQVHGGWGYRPDDEFHEGSITVCQLQALRAARNAGIHVPSHTIRMALSYLEETKSERSDWVYFRYRVGQGTQPSFPLAAAAISSLNAVGKYRTSTVDKGINFLERYLPGQETADAQRDGRFRQFWWYGQLYAVQAMYQAGGDHWERWYRAIRQELIQAQEGDGSWGRRDPEGMYGTCYPTSVALLVLSVPYRQLPILQR